MRDKDIEQLLHHADNRTVGRIAEQTPASDKDTKERIFREIQRRKALHADSPGVSETYITKEDRSINWRSVVSVAAAFVLIAGSVGGGFALHRHFGLTPGQTAEETLPAASDAAEPTEHPFIEREDARDITLAAANMRDDPWKGKVLQEEALGDLKLARARTTSIQYNGDAALYDALQLDYETPSGARKIAIHYTAAPIEVLTNAPEEVIAGEDFDIPLVADEKIALSELGHGAFIIDYGTYRVSLTLMDCTKDDLLTAVTFLHMAANQLTLSDATSADFPWKGHVIGLEEIGGLRFKYAATGNVFASDGTPGDTMLIAYGDPNTKGNHMAGVIYSSVDCWNGITQVSLTDGRLDADAILSAKSPGDGSFWVDYGDYRMAVTMLACTEDELRTLIDALDEAAAKHPDVPKLPDDLTEPGYDAQHITYEEANLFAGRYLPDKVLESELAALTLDESNILYTQKADPAADGTLHLVQWLTLSYKGSAGILEITIQTPGEFENSDIPESSTWSLKVTVNEPCAYAAGNDVYDFHFWVAMQDVDIMVAGRGTEAELDLFANKYSQLLYYGDAPIPEYVLSIDDANSRDYPWKGKLVTEDTIGEFTRWLTDLQYYYIPPECTDYRPMMNLYYRKEPAFNETYDHETGFTLSYTTATAQELNMTDQVAEDAITVEMLADERYHKGTDEAGFVYDFGDYRLRIRISVNCTEEELDELNRAIARANR